MTDRLKMSRTRVVKVCQCVLIGRYEGGVWARKMCGLERNVVEYGGRRRTI